MQVSWLHVSDFHIRGGDPYDRDVVLKTLIKSVKDFRDRGRAPDLIFATGDIAHGGKAAEYGLATQFFNDLLAAAKLEKDRLFVIPGNHDVDRDQGVGLSRTLASREESDKYFAPTAPKPHLTQKMGAFLSWHDQYFKGIRTWPRDTSCGPVELAEVRGTKLGILSINSALFCQDDDDHNKLLVGRRSLEGGLEQLKQLGADFNIALIHHPLDWLNDLERANIKSHLQAQVDFILRGHLHETEVENVASASGQSLFCAAGAAYQTRKWPNRAMYASLDGRDLTVFPIRYEDTPQEVWTVDPSLFPHDKDYERKFPVPRLAPTQVSPAPVAPAESAKSTPLPRFRSNIASRRGLPIVGREKDLEDILKVLNKPEEEAILVLHGHSGAGKSELAREFARRHTDRYPGGAFFLDASAGALDLDFASIGKKWLGLSFPPDVSLPEQGQQTFCSLGVVPTLLIYDNVTSAEAIAPWLPPAKMACHVLITSVDDIWDGWQSQQVNPLTPQDALQLVQQLGGREVAEKFGEQLAALAGGLPMQICPAAITLAHEQRRGRLDSAKISLVPEADKSFHLVYDRLEGPVRVLLHSALLFNHQRIPRRELATQFQQALGWSESDFEKRLDACFDLHLLEGSDELKLHQLFAGFLQSTALAPDQAELLKKVRAAQAERFKELASEVSAHPNRTDLASTLITFPLAPPAWNEAGAPIATKDGETVGYALYEIGRFDEARPWFEHAVAEKERGDAQGSVDHTSLGRSLHQMGYCWSSTGRFDEARPWYERAVAENEKGDVQGAVDHDSLGRSLHQVGYCWSQTGNYDQARPWYERAVAEKEKGDVHGRVNHDSLGVSLHQMGYCWSQTGQSDQARPWFERAVAEAEKGDVHGRVDHTSLGRSLDLVGSCWSQTGNYDQARPWYERAIAEKEKGDVHGRVNHESLGRSLHQVGYCWSQTGQYAQARPWFERAVAAKRKGDVFGKVDRASLGVTLKSVAVCLRELGKTQEAEAWEKEAAELESDAGS